MEYTKIQTIFKRDEKTKRIVEGDFSLPEFEYLFKCPWEFTEKVDGTNIRVMISGGSVVLGGRTDAAQIPASLVQVLQNHFLTTPKAKKLREIFEGGEAILYGEGYGNKIQACGKDYLADSSDFILFDVKVGAWWLERKDVNDVAEKLGIKSVPVIGTGTLQEAIDLVRGGQQSQLGNLTSEGIVARPKVTLFNRKGERIIAKIKHRDFL